jgi:cysteine desulfurase
MKAAYLDHNATSPVSEAVAARVGELLRAGLGNPSAAHGAGAQARAVVEAARAGVAALVGAHPSEVVFTSGGSEACATAVGHLWRQARRRGRQRPVLVAGATEHPAVLAALGALAEAGEAQVRLVAVDGDGRLCASALRRELDGADGLCAMAANNETGVMTDLEAVAGVVAASGAAWFCDAVQAVGRVPLRFHEAAAGQIALMALSGHKLGAPVGVGALVVRRGVEVTPLILGGQQQRGRRAGTEPAAMLGGLEVAAREAADALAAGEPARVGALRDELERALLAAFPGSRVHGAGAPRLPNTSSVSLMLPGGVPADGESMVLALAERGVAVATGAACATGSGRPSHVLLAMGATAVEAQATLRFSLGRASSAEHVAAAVAALVAVAAP